MIAMQRVRAFDVGRCNACESDEELSTEYVYEISFNHLVVRLCKQHFKDMVKLEKSVARKAGI